MLRFTARNSMLRVSPVAVAVAAAKGSSQCPTITLPKHRLALRGDEYRMPHLTYKTEDIETIEQTHRIPMNIRDRLAHLLVQFVRKSFDLVTRYGEGRMNKRKWVNRVLFLESVAGVPGMVVGMIRHLNSLRRMRHDHGWISHLLEEAENERMHLFWFLTEKNPGILLRIALIFTQIIFFTVILVLYLISPKFLHRFVGYVEEEAIHTYTVMIKDVDKPGSNASEWRTQKCSEEAIRYYGLPADATFRDMILCVRADEMQHREYNHLFADIHGKATDHQLIIENIEYTPPSPKK